MKVKRYLHGLTNIDMLESQRKGLLSPAQAAAGAGAKGFAMGEALSNVSNDLFKLKAHQKKLSDQQDRIFLEMKDKQRKIGITRIMDDPKYADEVQPDGTPSNTAVREAIAEFESEFSADFNQIQNPIIRKAAEGFNRLSVQETRLAVEKELNKKSEAWNAQGLSSLRMISLEEGDYAQADAISQELLDMGKITQEMYEFDLRQSKAAQKGEALNQEVDQLRKAYQSGGMDGAEAFIKRAIADPLDDQDDQRARITALRGALNNLGVLVQEQKDLQLARWSMEVNDIVAQMDKLGVINPDAYFQKWVDEGIPVDKAVAGRNEIYNAYNKTLAKNNAYSEAMDYQENGGIFTNNRKNRAFVDQNLQNIRANMPEGANDLQVRAATYNELGLVGEKDYRLLNNYKNITQMGEAAELYDAMKTGNAYSMPQTGLGASETAILEMVGRRAADRAMTWTEAAQAVDDERDLEPQVRARRLAQWDEENGSGRGNDAFNSLIDRRYEFRGERNIFPVIFRTELETANTEDNKFFYKMHYDDGFELTGDWAEAQAYADAAFESSHPVTNVNGFMEVQRGGLDFRKIKGVAVDWSVLQDQYLGEVTGQTFRINDQDVQLSKENISFQNPVWTNGRITYDVYADGIAAINPDFSGVAQVTFDEKDLSDVSIKAQQNTAQSNHDRTLAERKKEIEELTRKLEFGAKVSKQPDPKDVERLKALPGIIEREALEFDGS